MDHLPSASYDASSEVEHLPANPKVSTHAVVRTSGPPALRIRRTEGVRAPIFSSGRDFQGQCPAAVAGSGGVRYAFQNVFRSRDRGLTLEASSEECTQATGCIPGWSALDSV